MQQNFEARAQPEVETQAGVTCLLKAGHVVKYFAGWGPARTARGYWSSNQHWGLNAHT